MRPKPRNLKLSGRRLLGPSRASPRRSLASPLLLAIGAHLVLGLWWGSLRVVEAVRGCRQPPPLLWASVGTGDPGDDLLGEDVFVALPGIASLLEQPAPKWAEQAIALPSPPAGPLLAPTELVAVQAPTVATWTLPLLPPSVEPDSVHVGYGAIGQPPATTSLAGAVRGSGPGTGTGSGSDVGRATGLGSGGMGSGGAGPVYVRRPQPRYPLAARQHGWQGTTVLRVEVRADGRAGAVEVLRSSGHSVLDQAAQSAVRAARFRASARTWVEVPITFRLDS